MKKTFTFLILLISTTVLVACTPKEPPVDNATQTEESTGTADEAASNSTEDVNASNEKLNYYVDCINTHSNSVLNGYDRYLSWANEETGPTGSETVNYGVDQLYNDIQPCIDGLKKAKTMKPTYPTLDGSVDAYVSALSNVAPLIKEAHQYYDQEDYKDDGMAKGKEMHPKLIAAYKAFDEADATLRGELEKIQDELDVKRLADLEKTEGKKYAWHSTNVMVQAKKLLEKGNVADLKEIKLEDFQTALDNFENASKDLKTYDEAHKSELGPGLGASSFIDDSDEYLKSAKDLMRRVRDNTPYDEGEMMMLGGATEWMVEGSPGKLLYDYNSLVSASNTFNQFN